MASLHEHCRRAGAAAHGAAARQARRLSYPHTSTGGTPVAPGRLPEGLDRRDACRTRMILDSLPRWKLLVASCMAAVLAAVRPCRADEVIAVPLPEGSVLVECESLAKSNWHRYEDAEASGGAKILANNSAWVAEGEVELPGESYVVWVRSADNGAYFGHYHYDLTMAGVTKTMATVEPLGRGWVWERWGEISGGRQSIRLHNADSFPASADCILFTPDANYRPSRRPLVEVTAEVEAPLAREGGTCQLSFTPRQALEDQKLYCALRRGAGSVWSSEVPLPSPASSWQPGRATQVEVAFPSLRFMAPGDYSLIAELSGCEFVGHEEGDYIVASVTLGPWETAEPCVTKIRDWQDTPTLFINGQPTFAFTFLGVSTARYHEFGEIGGHLYSVGASIGNSKDGEFDSAGADGPFRSVLAEDPDAMILPRIGVTAPDWWLEAHPEERVVYDDGSVGPQSMASEQWLEDVGEQLATYVRHVRNSPYADRVIGFHICSGSSAEWQAWGLWGEHRGDFSVAMQRGFSSWLKEKYGSSGAVRAAWKDGTAVDLDDPDGVPIPSREARYAPGSVLLDPTVSQYVIDFYEFYPTVTARAIEHFARIAKRESDNEALAGVFYGYAPQYGPAATESQHLALARVLACPDIDFLSSPAMYSDRQPGGTSNFMSLTDSLQLHNKFWFHEADMRTHLQADKVGRCETMAETLAVLKREYGSMRAHGVGLWWFEMSGPWFTAPEIQELFGKMQAEGAAAMAEPDLPRFAPEIGVFLHERSCFRQRPGGGNFYHYGMTTQIASLRRVGAPVALHLLSDLAAAPDYKVNILLNATDLTETERRLIDERLKRDGKTVVFVYAPGFGRVGQRGMVTEDLSGVEEMTGLDFELSRSPGPMRATLVEGEALCGNPVLVEAYGGKDGAFGPDGELGPRFFVSAVGATVLATLADGRPAMVLKPMDGWTAVYSAVPGIPPGVIHNIARAAGVYVFTDAGDALCVGRGTLTLHARQAGEKLIRLPGDYDVQEALGGGGSWPATSEIRLQLAEKETAILEIRQPQQ